MAQVTPCQVGTQLPLKRGTALPEFSSYVYCGQTAVWIKMPLTEEGLGPGDIVLDGAQLAPPKRGTVRQFSALVYCGQAVAHLRY